MFHAPRRRVTLVPTTRLRHSGNPRRARSLRPLLEGLEDRTVLSTITWNTTAAPTGGDWDTAGNWTGGVIPTAADNAVIHLTSSGTITHSKSTNDAALSLSTTNASLSLTGGSIALG